MGAFRVGVKPVNASSDARSGIVIFDVEKDQDIVVMSVGTGDGAVTLKPMAGVKLDTSLTDIGSGTNAVAEHDHVAKKGDLDVDRNWKIEDDKFIIWNPANNAEIVIDIAQGDGEFVPSGIPEIVGQPEMLFSIAMGIKHGENVLLSGPTGTGKTTVLEWFAQTLRWNLVKMVFTPKTESAHMIGEPLPVDGKFPFIYGPVAQAVKLSQKHPTLLVLDEVSRIGNVAETSGILPLLDHQRRLEIPQNPDENMDPEVLIAGDLIIAGTENPASSDDDEDGSGFYIGVTELDPALLSRFTFHPKVGYMDRDTEVELLVHRTGITSEAAGAMVDSVRRIRAAADIDFPVSFRELVGWAIAYPYLGFEEAADMAVVRKAHPMFRAAVRGMLKLSGGKSQYR